MEAKLVEDQPVEVALDTGKAQTVERGRNFMIRLLETPTTGYRWVAENSEWATLLKDETLTQTGKPGDPAIRAFTYEASRNGRFPIRFRRVRAWNPSDVAEEVEVWVSII